VQNFGKNNTHFLEQSQNFGRKKFRTKNKEFLAFVFKQLFVHFTRVFYIVGAKFWPKKKKNIDYHTPIYLGL
jgi:hypothetical protein